MSYLTILPAEKNNCDQAQDQRTEKKTLIATKSKTHLLNNQANN